MQLKQPAFEYILIIYLNFEIFVIPQLALKIILLEATATKIGGVNHFVLFSTITMTAIVIHFCYPVLEGERYHFSCRKFKRSLIVSLHNK